MFLVVGVSLRFLSFVLLASVSRVGVCVYVCVECVCHTDALDGIDSFALAIVGGHEEGHVGVTNISNCSRTCSAFLSSSHFCVRSRLGWVGVARFSVGIGPV